ncbi:glycosyl hydrolase [Flavobacterium sp. K5-23]|uniref:VPS10 domain-containing protein n=1 Tax=Flavobacterium sp. K5-23 TaxID=2746225 RepID=UPI00200EF9DB|nr:glycosyl hydrolase [Flavobacterium sp. K5-23]UQD55403.1 glycosyl hydrolase [Flavobacterium sp. K5-23]
MKKSLLLLVAMSQSWAWAQSQAHTESKTNLNQNEIQKQSLFQNVAFKNVGPSIMSGRVVDLAVNPDNPIEFYVAYASGGLWYTNNNGTSFEPVMDTAPTLNCGSVAVDWKTGTIWVGTGEVNASRSSYAGIGILKSTDKGKSWENMGLPESHHISKIIISSNNPNEVTVGVTGHLYSKNKERGIYKTIDGGKTWNQKLFVDEETGMIDLDVATDNPKIMYATAWQKGRKAHHFTGNGKNSGIYKSSDAGENWQLISTSGSGFPNNDNVGRIGIAIYNSSIIYAILDNQNKKPSAKGEKPKDANAALFETEVIGAEVYKSIDGGTSWNKTNTDYIDGLYYSYGYYFGDITVDMKNENRIYLTGVPLLFSEDGGKSIEAIDGDNVHSDHHVVWINPKNSNHIINGNDGGVNISYDNGKHWVKCNSNAVGQFYAINVDNEEPYNIYGGLQDNGVWVGPNDFKESTSWQANGEYPYKGILGGDGMQIQIDNRNSNIVIAGSQHGNYSRLDRSKNKVSRITPMSKKGEDPFRFNWQTPVLLSSHNQDILYFGSNFLHRSMDQGDNWTIISADLTQGKKEGNVPFGTLTTISESEFQFGLLYTGSDDGLVNVSKDGGVSWSKISDDLPKDLWVSRVKASLHKKERVYVSLNGYRNDDFTPYVFVSEDYGNTWKNISGNLPSSPVNVIIEDNVNESILYVGTDNGLYISMDKGASWQDFSTGIPNVAVHDLVIQKKAKDLVVGTHGRSLYKTSIAQVQQLDAKITNKSLHLFETEKIKKSERWGASWSKWDKAYEPETDFWFYASDNGVVTITVENEDKVIVYTKTVEAIKGLNNVKYDLSLDKAIAEKWAAKNKELKLKAAKNDKYYLPIGQYKVGLSKGKEKITVDLVVVK